MALYTGFSSLDFSKGISRSGLFPSLNTMGYCSPLPNAPKVHIPGNNTLILTDIKLVERNILNHIFTKKGTRVMMPNFGTTIPSMVFEPLDEYVIESVRSDVESVVAYDPRVRLVTITVVPNYDTNSLSVSLMLQYIELNVTQGMNFNIEFTQ
jgi:phage baseplate assembly protein W